MSVAEWIDRRVLHAPGWGRGLHRARMLLRFALPAPWRWGYLHEMRRSRLFDRQFYRSTNPHLHPLFRAFPERHYAIFGEAMGLRPNPDFCPRAYLTHNPDLAGEAAAPFRHFLRAGRHEQRLTKTLPPVDRTLPIRPPVLRPRPATAQIALVVHLYYHDMWPEIAEAIEAAGLEHDLFVTITHKGTRSEDLRARIARSHPHARVILMPNHGRDIFPFLHLANAGLLDGYRAIGKLHTKKSPHRQDGDHWRRHLIDGILPGAETGDLLARFLADPQAGFWVADGQQYQGDAWWGSNHRTVGHLLRRVEIRAEDFPLSFPAGSIYWMKPLMLSMLKGLQLSQAMFEPETGQVDGTLAHAVERAIGHLVQAAGMRIVQTSQLIEATPPPAPVRPRFVSAAYLPQFHPTPENDAWWGAGFTEWASVTRAQPRFPGHQQPMLPGELGFYDLRLPEVMARQAELARGAGVDAFCVYHYWFDGRRVLEQPMERLLASPETDFPFYLCWANESWRRNWDGLSGEVLLEQSYAPGFEAALARDLLPYLRDPRHARPDGTRPRFVIYRPDDLPEPGANIARLRAAWRDLGLGEVELGAVRFHVAGENPVEQSLFDFWIEMPPHGLVQGPDILFGGPAGNRLGFDPDKGFEGLIYDYAAVIRNSLAPDAGRPERLIAGVMPSWDNSARRGGAYRLWRQPRALQSLALATGGGAAWHLLPGRAVHQCLERMGREGDAGAVRAIRTRLPRHPRPLDRRNAEVKMARLVLHIGMHKTASTTIQDMLFHNRANLADYGLIYPFVGETRGHHGLVTRWVPMPRPYALRGDPMDEWQRIAHDYADRDGTVFLSSEEFSRAHPRRVDLFDLRRLTEPYESVQVICLLRNQRGFLQSVYGQIARDRPAPEVRSFIRSAMEGGFADGLWMDYDALAAHLETAFEPEELTFLSYEAAAASEGGVVGEMLRQLGLPLKASALEPFSKERSNVSPDPLAAMVAGAIARPGIAPPALVALVDSVLREQFGPDMRGTIYTPEESAELARRFAPANASFETRRGALQPDLRLAPLTPPGEEIGRDRLTRPVWEKVARAVYHAGAPAQAPRGAPAAAIGAAS